MVNGIQIGNRRLGFCL